MQKKSFFITTGFVKIGMMRYLVKVLKNYHKLFLSQHKYRNYQALY